MGALTQDSSYAHMYIYAPRRSAKVVPKYERQSSARIVTKSAKVVPNNYQSSVKGVSKCWQSSSKQFIKYLLTTSKTPLKPPNSPISILSVQALVVQK